MSLSYGFINEVPALNGQVANLMDCEYRTGVSEELIPFGRILVSKGDYVGLPSTTGETFVGVSTNVDKNLYEQVLDSQDYPSVPILKPFNLLTEGDVYIFTETALAIGDPIYFRHTANGAGKNVLGVIRNTADTATCDLLTTARVVQPASANSLARIHINLD